VIKLKNEYEGIKNKRRETNCHYVL